ncbi:TetR/AcrR family transcriptional regulator [Cerasibacillus terrae]|uniref:TetR/AcrR family transcriptional regulator n=1 Tax=Cerasibacillus terrae TaxID=2498845 RepID=A0A5C8P2K3_9BACI|nr:TetR/AcrR family transcriptional regulator [Cerasibacillus terrae]TXL67517.1 TetR/AcrR family transcriptional regulator [Cerasibacillus terrae]
MNIDRKQLIIDAASKSFSAFGYKATTMDQVAKLAKVGKGTIYTFYKNKEELFHEIISSLIKEMKRAAEEVMDNDDPFFINADRVLYTLLEFRTEHQLMIKLLQEEKEIGTPAVTEVVQKLEDTIVKYMSNIIKEGIVSGEIKDCDPELTAFVILKLYVSLIFDWEKTREPLEKEQISEFFHLYLMNGLSNR